MKNIEFYFGYNGNSKYSKFTYWLCKTFPFIPCIELRLFNCYKGGESKGKPYIIRHDIWIGIFKYYWKWEYILHQKKWRFTDLSK